MAFEFLHFKNLNTFGGLRPLGGFQSFCPMSFCMPAFFRMPQFTPISLFSFNLFTPTLPIFTAPLFNTNIFTPFNNKTTEAYLNNFKLTDIPLDGFKPVNYAIPPMNFNSAIYNTSLFTFNKAGSASKKYTSTKYPAPSTTTSIEEVNKIYNKEKGKKLAEVTIAGLEKAESGYCARAVKTGIKVAGLGAYEPGHASEMPRILSTNSNFKEVKVAATDLDKLPAGCVLCYEPGDCGYSAENGHTETTDGNGNAYSFFVNRNIKKSDNVRVFVPV